MSNLYTMMLKTTFVASTKQPSKVFITQTLSRLELKRFLFDLNKLLLKQFSFIILI